MADLTRWLWYTLSAGHEPELMHKLYKAVGDIDKIYSFCEKELKDLGITNDRFIDALCDKDLFKAQRELMYCQQFGIELITVEDKNYPFLLSQIYDPPLVLYVRGVHFNPADEVYVAVVGTRNATRYGLEMARVISRDLASAGITVVSGMAQGVDSAAHIGSMQGGGKTIAVLGSGVNVAYPKENRDLMVHIMNNGCILSEFGLEYEFRKNAFPRRNRIMCGLCSGVLVVEAPSSSGALITAHMALDEGRDLFAVPGNISNSNAQGVNTLLKNCAKMVTSANDIIEEYEALYPHCIKRKKYTTYNAEFEMALTKPNEQLMSHVVNLLDGRPMQLENIASECQMSSQKISGILAVLMKLNAIELCGCNMYVKSRQKEPALDNG